jgi:molybdopterin synthase catalytic subunit
MMRDAAFKAVEHLINTAKKKNLPLKKTVQSPSEKRDI